MRAALLTAAGTGCRMHQNIPKQFIHVDNKPIIIYTMEAFQRHPDVDYIAVVTLEAWIDVLKAYALQFNIDKLKWIVPGDDTLQGSIYCGLCAMQKDLSSDDVVIVHDGNRPLVSERVISESLHTFSKYGNAVAAIPCAEVIFESDSRLSSCKSIDRDRLFRTQTPHTYSMKDITWAYEEAIKRGIHSSPASCALMQELGYELYLSKGSEINLKITTTEDLRIFKALLNTRNYSWIRQ